MKRLALIAALLLAPLAALAQPGPSPGGLGISTVVDPNGNVVNGTRQMNITGTSAVIVNPTPGTGNVNLAINPFAGANTATLPCDAFSQGCVASFWADGQTSALYHGNVLTLQRADGQSASFAAVPLSGLVNAAAIHAFADGQDTACAAIPNQAAGATDAYIGGNGVFANMPMLSWEANGLPVCIGGVDLWIQNTGLPTNGRWMRDTTIPATGPRALPTTGSQELLVITDNGVAGNVDVVSSSSDNAPIGRSTGDVQGGAMAPEVLLSAANVPTPPSVNNMFCQDLETGTPTHLCGPYAQGYQQIAGVDEYSLPNQEILTQVLTSACVPTTTVSCATTPGYAGTSAVPINTGIFGAPILRMFSGTDNTSYPGHFQGLMITNYAPTSSENSVALNNIAFKTFGKQPGPCGVNTLLSPNSANSGALTSTNPTIYPATIQNFIGRPVINTSNLVAAWGFVPLNPYWNNQIFGAQRADKTTPQGGYDIWPLGCEADTGQMATDLTGTTGTIPHLWDQSGNSLNFVTHDQLTEPALSQTGINGKPCAQFTPTTLVQTTSSIAPGSPAGSIGILTVTAVVSGTLQPGMATGSLRNGVILSQLTSAEAGGALGLTGTYSITDPAGTTVSSGTVYFSASPYMTQITRFNNDNAGFSQNITVGVVFQTTGTVVAEGAMISQQAGWWFGNVASASTLQLAVGHNGVVDVSGQVYSANTPHFAWFQFDGSSPPNVTIGLDGQAPIGPLPAGTLAQMGAGQNFLLGEAVSGVVGGFAHFRGCIAAAFIYNDNETANSLAQWRAVFQQEYGTP